jgi:hypothetical protein
MIFILIVIGHRVALSPAMISSNQMSDELHRIVLLDDM